MKFHEIRDYFNTEDSVKLLNNGTSNKVADRAGQQRISKPVVAFKTETGSRLLIDGLFEKIVEGKKSGQYVVSMIENTTGTINKQDMNFSTFKKMVDIGMITHDNEGAGDLKQKAPVGSTNIVDMFTPEQINELMINGFYEDKCIAAGRELNVKPVAALKNLDMGENTVIVYGFSKTRNNNFNFLCWVEDLSGDELEVSRMEIPAEDIYKAIDSKKIEVNKDYKISEKLHVFKEAYMREGYLVSDPEKLKEVKNSIKKNEKEFLTDSFDPEIHTVKELDEVSISGMDYL